MIYDVIIIWAGDIALAAAESDGLITSDGYTFIRDGGDALPY